MSPTKERKERTRNKKPRERKVEYRYTESGLDNVVLGGITVRETEDGDELIILPAINMLHRAIAKALLELERSLTGKEIKFLRTEMGLTQEEMAEKLKVTRKTINTWESDKHGIDSNAEFVLRTLASEKLEIELSASVDELIDACRQRADSDPIVIDSSMLDCAA